MEQELADRQAELDFAAAMSSLTILRHALARLRFPADFNDTTFLPTARGLRHNEIVGQCFKTITS